MTTIWIDNTEAIGQTQLELNASSASLTVTGPTTASQTATFLKNDNGSTVFSAATPTTTVNYAITNQVYSGGTYPGIFFGGTSSGQNVVADNIWKKMNTYGGATSIRFSSNPFTGATQGIDVTLNYCIGAMISPYYMTQLYRATNLNARPYYGDITISFNRPVQNPVLHFAAIGGEFSSANGLFQHGFYTEFELGTAEVAAGYTFTRLSGNTYFGVGNNTQVINTNTTIPASNTPGYFTAETTRGSDGSVRLNTNGTNISSIVLRVFLRGMPGVNPTNTQASWGPTNGGVDGYVGDVFTLSATLPTYNITGTVYNDADGMTNNIIDGTATRYAGGTTQLYVNLVDNNNNVYASTAVSSTGTYTFANVVAAAGYKLVLSTSNAVTTASLPAAWAYTGEKEGSGTGSDGTPNGILPLGVLTADVTTRFGIRNCSSPPAVTAAAGTALYCAQSATSPIQLTATPTGGQAPYTYAWTGSGISNATIQNPTATPAAAGSYTVAITDALGCKASASTGNITYDNTVPSISWSCGTNPAWLRLNETNGTTWYWTTASGGKFYPNNTYNPAQDATTSALQQPYIKVAGPYTVKITSVNGCTSSGTINMSATPAGCATVLADEHIRLTAAWAGNNNVLVKWNTPLTNISNFTIQRSTNGTNFTDIGTTEYTQPSAYSFTDVRIPAGCSKLWYRVKATDHNGRENFSSAASLNCNGISAGNIFVAPNPVVNKQFTLNYKVPVTGKLNYELLSVDGKRILAGILENPAPGETASKTIVLPPLEKGLYFLRVSNQQWISKTVKLMIGE
ncbi:T9SS type A sorting domain-containing protein [Panacibacter sp. DH6]|uniref:T9SS type A sorting domain-containing protein n=1 Tax=Panacibacter microcysteis TaxID=2793269 RepID=A0A931EAT0_9BACT|nr:T9SS type A sorting domain-containing protein [Panacibacter microcysteis]MBG9377484.1 T9SS type A sorting domain-containing protein [Panacibacter microcysteis]